MKVVLFCGGLGTRIRDYSESVPKPMITIGYRPILWHVMKYYSYYGHNDFILCLGYKADIIKDYFLNYNECISNDFVLSDGGRTVELLGSDIQGWKITFVNTGLRSNIGQRLSYVKRFLEGEEYFLANYSDGLTDLHLPSLIDYSRDRDKIASFIAVRPTQSFHLVSMENGGVVADIVDTAKSEIRINGGYFVFKTDIFNYIHKDEELVEQPFHRLIKERQLVAYQYDGFWACMDTFKDKQMLDERVAAEQAPWQVWNAVARA